MRPLLTFLLLVFAHASALGEVSVVRVWTHYRDAASFERMSEFFTGKENLGGDLMVRSQSDDRKGFYLMLRLKNHGSELRVARTELRVVLPSSSKPKNLDGFAPFQLPPGSHVVHIGITGADWPEGLEHPVAWELRLLDAEGGVLIREASFLWGSS